MSNNHIDPDLAVEVFILEPAVSEAPEHQRVDGHTSELDSSGLEFGWDGRPSSA